MAEFVLEPLEEVMNKFKQPLALEGYRTVKELQPVKQERQLIVVQPDYKIQLCNLLVDLSKAYQNMSVNSDSPRSVEIALLYSEEINLMEQRLRNMLPIHLQNKEAREFEFVERHHLVNRCFYADLLELKEAMLKKYHDRNAARRSEKRRQKKALRREKTSQQQEATVEPQNPGEADDDLDINKVNVGTEQASVEPQNPGEADDDLDIDKVNVETEQACVPNISSIHYSPGETTNYKTYIFEGNLTIPIPSNITNITSTEPINVMYFKMDEFTYEISGFPWANFSMRNPCENILSVYGAGRTMDGQFFIACESWEQSLATWLEDPQHFSVDKPLSSTLKSFFKDVIKGAAYVHKQSKGLLAAEITIGAVYICNERAKLGLLTQMEPTSDITATFRSMVVKEVFKCEPIPVDLMHLLNHMKQNRWHPSCLAHPMFFSASQTCIYVKLACETSKACSPAKLKIIANKLNNNSAVPDVDWIINVKHEALLEVLKYKSEVNTSGAGNDGEDGKKVEKSADKGFVGPVEGEGGQVNKEVCNYSNNGWSFLEFYRNVVVHIKWGTLTDEELVIEMNKILPNFLLRIYEVLTREHLFVTVGEDFTLEEEERSACL